MALPDGLPKGWGDRLHTAADLEASLGELDGLNNYAAESCRARVHSLMLHWREADACFRQLIRIMKAEFAALDQVQLALAASYEREHALMKGQPRGGGSAARRFLAEDKSARVIVSNHRSLDAAESLFRGEVKAARAIYSELIANYPEAGPERKATWNIGLAACGLNLDSPESSICRHLEIAGWSLCLPDCRTLARAQQSAKLSAIYEQLDDVVAAQEWEEFLDGLACPQATKDVARERAEILAVRSARLQRCVVC